MNTMNYKKYNAIIEYSDEDGCLIGHIAGINDIIGFHGDTVEEVRVAFHEAVDDYLESCAKEGLEPNKPYSGRVMLRIPPDLHAKLALHASAQGKSLNSWLVNALDKSVQQHP